jgi:polysaccharide biosynthesis protein PslF
VDGARPDIVHVQHGRYMGRDRRVPAFLEGLRQRGVRSVVTLHAVYPDRHRSLDAPWLWAPPAFHRAVGESSDQLVVHHRAGTVEHLAAAGVPTDRITVIPHGTPETAAADRGAARQELHLAGNAAVVLFLGFISVSKGLDTVVRAFELVARDVPRAVLVVAGRVEPAFPSPQYGWWLRRLVRPGVEAGWIDFRPGYVDERQIPTYLAAADLTVFPYRQRHGSSSGMLHRALAAGCAVAVSSSPKFEDVREALGEVGVRATARPGDLLHWAATIKTLVQDDALRAELSRAARALARRTAWPIVADQHVALYRRVLAGA